MITSGMHFHFSPPSFALGGDSRVLDVHAVEIAYMIHDYTGIG